MNLSKLVLDFNLWDIKASMQLYVSETEKEAQEHLASNLNFFLRSNVLLHAIIFHKFLCKLSLTLLHKKILNSSPKAWPIITNKECLSVGLHI